MMKILPFGLFVFAFSSTIFLLCLSSTPVVFANPDGAPEAACTDQIPAGHNASSSYLPAGTVIEFDASSYSACSAVPLTIKTANPIRGFLLSMVKFNDATFTRQGTFHTVSSDVRSRSACSSSTGSAITHGDPLAKSNIKLLWTPPDPWMAQQVSASATAVEFFGSQGSVWYKLNVVNIPHSSTLVKPIVPQTLFIANAAVSNAGSAMISLQWQSSFFCQGNAAISSFAVEIDANNTDTFNTTIPLPLDAARTGSVITNQTVSDLLTATNYRFRLAATSDIGVGYSNIISITTATISDNPPSSPTLSTVNTTSSSITLSWIPSISTLPLIRYSLEKSSSATGPFTVITSNDFLSTIFTDTNQLSPSTNYYYRVRSLNAAGLSQHSPVLTVTSAAPAQTGGNESESEDGSNNYYTAVIVGLAVIFLGTLLYSRPFALNGSFPLSTLLNHKRPWPIMPSYHPSYFDALTLSIRHSLWDWTVGEYLVIIIYIVVLVVFLTEGYQQMKINYFIFGHSSAVHLALTLLPVQRHSIWTQLFNLPFERLIKWHRYLGRMTLLWTIVHLVTMLPRYKIGGEDPPNMENARSPMAGYYAFILLLIQWLSSFERIRRLYHEIFFYIHMIGGPLAIIGAMVHVPIFQYYAIIPLVLYGIDHLWRLFSATVFMPVKSIKLLAEETAPITFIEIDYKKRLPSFSYEAGQYIFLSVPDISYQKHPFTISSAPMNGRLTIHAMSMGPGTFTDQLAKLAKKYTSDEKDHATNLQVRFDGPFGKLSVPVFDGGYNQLVLIGGGVGFTPIASISSELLHRYESDQLPPSIKNITVIWIARHSDTFTKWMPDLLQKLLEKKEIFTLQLFASTPLSPTVAIPVVDEGEGAENNEGKKEAIELLVQSRSSAPNPLETPPSISNSAVSPPVPIHYRRPNIQSLFGQLSAMKGVGKGGVVTCGPVTLMNDVQAAAQSFDYHLHKETFLL